MDGQRAGGDHPEADARTQRCWLDSTAPAHPPHPLFFGPSPVLVELDGKVGHVLQGLVGEAHVHVHVALAAREGAGDLQALCLHRREPHLDGNSRGDQMWRRSERRPCALTAFGGTYPPVVMAMPVDSSNKSLRPLLAAGGAGVGDGAKVLGTDDGMKFWPT